MRWSDIGEGSVLDGRYRLDAVIGCGGTAEVYRGTDLLLARAVAVKMFDAVLTDLNSVERQRTEMTLLAGLDHPHLVAVYDAHIATAPDAGQPAGHSYLVMELVAGATLADRLCDGAVPAAEARRIAVALSGALAAVHQQELVHRDVKPGNVLVASGGRIKLADFGLARLLTAEQRVTTSAELMGTAAYLSPEQATGGEVGPPSDVYSLGLVLLECLTGHREFPGDPVPAAVARLLRDPVVPAWLPAPWPALLTAMTDARPSRRPTADEVTSALVGPADARLSTVAVPEGAPDPVVNTGVHPESDIAETGPMAGFWQARPARDPGPTRRRNAWWVGLLAAAAAATVAFTVLADVGGSAPTAGPVPTVGAADAATAPATRTSNTVTRRSTPPAGTRAAVAPGTAGHPAATPKRTGRMAPSAATTSAQQSMTASSRQIARGNASGQPAVSPVKVDRPTPSPAAALPTARSTIRIPQRPAALPTALSSTRAATVSTTPSARPAAATPAGTRAEPARSQPKQDKGNGAKGQRGGSGKGKKPKH